MRLNSPPSHPHARRLARACSGIARVVLGVLLLALTLAGTVPQGMMRAPDGVGQRLVLCTPDGPREIWMGEDGVARDHAPLPAQNHETGKCLSVTLALTAVQGDFDTLFEPAHFDRFKPDLTAPRAAAAPLRHRPQTRAPPAFRLS